MDEWVWFKPMEVAQAEGNISKDGVSYFLWKSSVFLDAVSECHWKEFHDKDGYGGVVFIVDTKKLDNVRVTKSTEYATLGLKTLKDISSLPGRLVYHQEGFVEFLPSTF